ncbi:sn-glycerol-3-phosphate ABC transporter ATP-binding protein UgpC [Bacillus aquiflavi]|uniref:sn-glycerol-3-phosphate ABC transporter ATP-binding protein UgpC n=1 Tax=Bacillus aquiflavi TaxID=2672567 RepID=A0A6B3VV13_9BACI|nr:sn-glycerol-3-phosphate ABC transporter ATP-binding protein UgpC [Bacillus aquiflavi]MBA4535729.1 sn-glycerol-3-phosphate ABC transporter ATP-binding protein UgpC [Bacillus aquiflavi]NEY80105.1 sn-glycerol-3-phosphate ABC transporter ATP-binding protein UgpC [Bacillus aquiflavi]
MKKVELINVSKSYDKKNNVISNIHVCIEPGEFFVLVGPSGCGKSTMLRMIAGLEPISEGIVKIGNQEVNMLPPSKRDISMVFQNYALYPHLTVEENIVFGLHVKKISKKVRKERCNHVAKMLGLSRFLKRKPRELSGGQRQRVALARAIVNEAPICLMDEPLSNLDAKLRAHMRSEIKQIQRRLGITMIYVTHDQVEAMTMGDRIMILNEGKIQQIGSPLDIYNKPANPFVATFIGSPPMNLAEGIINHSTSEIVLSESCKLKIPDHDKINCDNIILGIRPEHIKHSVKEKGMLVEVTNVEILGNETVISFIFGEDEWLAKWYGQWRIKVGDVIPISIAYDSICLFNSNTEEVIKTPINIDNYVIDKEVLL